MNNAPAVDAERKRFESLRARAALGSFELYEMPDLTFVARRWDRSVELRSLAEVEAFLRRVEPRR